MVKTENRKIKNEKRIKIRNKNMSENFLLFIKGMLIGFIVALLFYLFKVSLNFSLNTIFLSMIVGGFGWLILKKLGKRENFIEKFILLIWIFILINSLFSESNFLFFIFLGLSMLIYFLSKKIVNYNIRISVLLTFFFIMSFLIGQGGIYPFGKQASTGYTGYIEFTKMFSILLYPLFYSLNLIGFKGGWLSTTDILRNVPLFFLVVIYYYILSFLIVSLINRFVNIFKAKYRKTKMNCFISIIIFIGLLFSLQIVSGATDNNLSNNVKSMQVNVVSTYKVTINYVPVDFGYNNSLLNHELKNKLIEK